MRGLNIYLVGVCAFTALLIGCAESPESIPSANVSEVTYQSLSCQDLTDMSGKLDQALVTATNQGNTPEISRLKGDLETIRRVRSQKQCNAS